MTTSAWLGVPLADYEGHMRAPAVAQLDVLSEICAGVLRACRPRSVAILGVAGGNGLESIDPAITTRVVGVDVNPAYLAETKRRFAHLPGLELHCADLAAERVAIEPVDLVHAALIFEHAGTGRCLENALALLSPGARLSVVLQLPSDADQAVGSTGFESIRTLAAGFALVDPQRLIRVLDAKGVALESQGTRGVASGKAFWAGLFRAGSVRHRSE
jgi:hypothetical protein